jgi:hypothetical protein
MRWLMAGLFALLAVSPVTAAAPQPADFASTESITSWISGYRVKPDPDGVPAAMRALSRFGAFNDPERCGVYVGFLAGVIATNPDKAYQLISKTMAMRKQDRWIIVRAIAYSGLPDWKQLLRWSESRMPRYDVMSEKYLAGKKATLAQFTVPPSPTTLERMGEHLQIGKSPRKVTLEPSQDVLDLLWGYYFATGSYRPIMHLIALLPWSRDHNDIERLTIGNMAKYTLARNAAHDDVLLAMLKASIKARNQPPTTVAVLKEVVDAAETVDTTSIHKEALAAIEELKRKGPAYKRNVSWWGYIGQSAIAGGCIAAALTGQVALGIPCVVGGAASSAAMNFWNNQP